MDIPPELVLEILKGLPWTSRRRLRLVSRSWRDLVHKHTTEMKQRRHAVPLILTTHSAYVVDIDHEQQDPYSKATPLLPRELPLMVGRAGGERSMEVVGVCNGVVCMCDGATPGGAITLANPATGDVLALPPMPRDGLFRRHNSRRSGRSWHQAYSFGYHHATGQYKVVHVPCFFKAKDAVHVFTLGDVSWREVPAPTYARCKLDAGLVTADGATYWVAEGSEDRIMSFDLDTHQVTCTKPLPMAARPIRHLTQLHRRLAVTTATDIINNYYVQVWLLEITRKEQSWIHLYKVSSSPERPYFVHGRHVYKGSDHNWYMNRPKPINHYDRNSGCTAVHDGNTSSRKIVVSNMRGRICEIFEYVKTEDALGIYRRW